MGVFSGARSEGFTSRHRPVTARSRRVRSTDGLVRDPWQAMPHAARDVAESPFGAVRGVSLEMFTDIAKATGSPDDVHARGSHLALGMGIEPNDWRLACRSWNLRIASNVAVARQFTMRFRDEVVDVI